MGVLTLEVTILDSIVGVRRTWLGGLALVVTLFLCADLWQHAGFGGLWEDRKGLAWDGVSIWLALWVFHGVKGWLVPGARASEQ